MKLTHAKLKSIKFDGTQRKLADGHGLYVLLTPTSKLWKYRYRWAGKEQVMSFGQYPLVSIGEARDKRD